MALLLGLIAAGCATSSANTRADVQAAKRFNAFPLYWVGERFEKWSLTSIDIGGPASFITFVYGTCAPSGGEQPSCTPPLEIQVSALCTHLGVVARAPIWKRRRIRGAPVGSIDSAPVLFTSGAQVKVYRGEGSDSGLALRALRALRSINHVAPVISSTGAIPPPAPGVLEGTRSCVT